MRYHEIKGHWPLMKPKISVESTLRESPISGDEVNVAEHGLVEGKMAV